jgi:hypothetical protein
MKRRVARLLLVVPGCLLAGMVLWPARPVLAEPPVTPQPTTTPAPGGTITENIFHTLVFPFETMTKAILQMSGQVLQQLNAQAQGVYSAALDALITSRYGISPLGLGSDVASTPLFADLIRPHWNVTFTFALLLLPATLAITALTTMKTSVVSVLTYADLKEALIGWALSGAGAAASFFVLGMAHRLSLLAAIAILQADFGGHVTGATLSNMFFSAAGLSLIGQLSPAAVLYVAGFLLFLAGGILIGLALAIAAYTALVYVLTVIAPLVLTLGVLPPLRWLNALWLKAVTLVILLPVVDAILLKAVTALAVGFFDPASGSHSLGGFIASVFVTAGVLGALFTINWKVAEAMFGALGEVHRQFQGAVMGVLSLAAAAAGVALGMPLAGLAPAAASAGAGGGGATGSGGPTSLDGGGSGGAPAASQNAARAPEAGPQAGPPIGGQSVAGLVNGRLSQERVRALAAGTNGAGDGQDSRQASTDPGGSNGAVSEATGENAASGQDQPSPAPAAESRGESPAAHLRQAHLMSGLGRALATSHVPVLGSFGAGLQAGAAVAAHEADMALDSRRTTEALSREQLGAQGAEARQERALLDRALRWEAPQLLSSTPAALHDLGRDNTDLMSGALHYAMRQAGPEPRASDLQDTVGVVRESYGAWLAQGRPGGFAAQESFFQIVREPNNAASADQLTAQLTQWSQSYGLSPAPQFSEAVKRLFERGEPLSS